MILDTKINAFLKSPDGKKKVAEAKAKALKEGRSFGQSGGSISKADAMKFAEKMRAILVEKLSGIADVGVFVGEPVIDADGDITIDINFDPGTLHRDSLYQEGYPNGVDNIVSLLVHGWDARDYVYGYSEKANKVIRSIKHRDSNEVLQQAIDEFNALGIGVAELNEKYI